MRVIVLGASVVPRGVPQDAPPNAFCGPWHVQEYADAHGIADSRHGTRCGLHAKATGEARQPPARVITPTPSGGDDAPARIVSVDAVVDGGLIRGAGPNSAKALAGVESVAAFLRRVARLKLEGCRHCGGAMQVVAVIVPVRERGPP